LLLLIPHQNFRKVHPLMCLDKSRISLSFMRHPLVLPCLNKRRRRSHQSNLSKQRNKLHQICHRISHRSRINKSISILLSYMKSWRLWRQMEKSTMKMFSIMYKLTTRLARVLSKRASPTKWRSSTLTYAMMLWASYSRSKLTNSNFRSQKQKLRCHQRRNPRKHQRVTPSRSSCIRRSLRWT
jgi:hypothetical protein